MTIRPIELQLSIPKSFDASKEQQNFLKRADIDSQQKAFAAEQEIRKKMNSVNDTKKNGKKELRNDAEDNKRESEEKSKNKKDERGIKEDRDFCFTPGKLDIKI